jgi:hypothetical protein
LYILIFKLEYASLWFSLWFCMATDNTAINSLLLASLKHVSEFILG